MEPASLYSISYLKGFEGKRNIGFFVHRHSMLYFRRKVGPPSARYGSSPSLMEGRRALAILDRPRKRVRYDQFIYASYRRYDG